MSKRDDELDMKRLEKAHAKKEYRSSEMITDLDLLNDKFDSRGRRSIQVEHYYQLVMQYTQK